MDPGKCYAHSCALSMQRRSKCQKQEYAMICAGGCLLRMVRGNAATLAAMRSGNAALPRGSRAGESNGSPAPWRRLRRPRHVPAAHAGAITVAGPRTCRRAGQLRSLLARHGSVLSPADCRTADQGALGSADHERSAGRRHHRRRARDSSAPGGFTPDAPVSSGAFYLVPRASYRFADPGGALGRRPIGPLSVGPASCGRPGRMGKRRAVRAAGPGSPARRRSHRAIRRLPR